MSRWRILGFVAGGLLVVLLAWLLRGAVYRVVIIPIQFIFYYIHAFYLSLPHELLWGLFLVLAYVVVLNSVYRRPRTPEQVIRPSSRYAEMRISQLARYIAKRKRPFYRHRLKFVLTELAVQVVTQKKRITLLEARNLVNRKELDVPEEMKSYLKDGLMPWAYGSVQPPGLLRQLLQFRRKEKEADDLSMQVLEYIEEQMEIERNGNSTSL